MRRKQCRLADFKNSFYLLIFSAKNKTVVKKKKNVREFVSGLILAVAVRENVQEPLKLGLISG